MLIAHGGKKCFSLTNGQLVGVDSCSWWVIFMKYANTVSGRSKQTSKHRIWLLRTLVLQSTILNVCWTASSPSLSLLSPLDPSSPGGRGEKEGGRGRERGGRERKRERERGGEGERGKRGRQT